MPAKRSILFIILCGHLYAQSQANKTIKFIPVFDQQTIQEGIYISNGNQDSVQFNTLKFYLSGVQLFKKEKKVWAEENSYHLVNVFDPKHYDIKIKDVEFDKINFSLGLDSTINNSGALGGDLDPTTGMYWAWQSGYINVKIEGKYKTRDNKINDFSYHLGGYLFPFVTIQSLELELNNSNTSVIYIDLSLFIQSIDFNNQKDVMSPGSGAVKLSSILVKCFRAKQ